MVGPPGSGKSTFAKLLLGLARPDHGRVLIDDLDVRLWSPAVLRQQVGVVPQEVQLFAGSIAENIALGALDRSFERVVAAAKFVGAHEFIQRLPAGYETVLGERGGGLSAGQRQLISIARALIRNPRLLVLDEATSGLDAATEEALLLNLKRASRGRTIVMMTHRLAALAIADRVVLLGDGRIEHEGPPGQVVAFARARQPAGAAAAAPGAGLTDARQVPLRLCGAHRFAEFLPDAEGVIERGHSPVAGLLVLTIAAAFARPARLGGADRDRAGGARRRRGRAGRPGQDRQSSGRRPGGRDPRRRGPAGGAPASRS